ncbi:C4-dicarboxylate ABC transporter substrate-binding protein, partial [Vibrio sp. 10N.222.54.A1]
MKLIKNKIIAGVTIVATAMLSHTAAAANFKMAIGDAAGGTQWELATSFSELMEQKTNGKVKIDLFPNGQLGNEQDTV